jgi:Spy/CpxP family protein refolding chaperone
MSKRPAKLMSFALAITLAPAAPASSVALGAQQAPPAPAVPIRDGQRAAKSMNAIVQYVTEIAFRGISITDDQRARARTIIIAATQDQQRLESSRPDFIDRRQVIANRRRETLRALLTSDGDRKRFDENYPGLEP